MVGGADAQAWNVFHKLWQLDTQLAEFVEVSQAFIILWRNIAKAVDLKGRHCGCNVCYEMCIFVSFVCGPLGYVHINRHCQPKDVEFGVTRFIFRVCVTL